MNWEKQTTGSYLDCRIHQLEMGDWTRGRGQACPRLGDLRRSCRSSPAKNEKSACEGENSLAADWARRFWVIFPFQDEKNFDLLQLSRSVLTSMTITSGSIFTRFASVSWSIFSSLLASSIFSWFIFALRAGLRPMSVLSGARERYGLWFGIRDERETD